MALSNHKFWTAAADSGTYRPSAGLWAPQRRAVGTAVAYLGAVGRGSISESALIKMPTGTGKSGVIATLACALPEVSRTLIITPRRSLVDQMLNDVHWRFWKHFNLEYGKTGLRASQRSGAAPTDTQMATDGVMRLLPSTSTALSSYPKGERLVVVGTFNALAQILRPPRPAHRLTGSYPTERDEVPTDVPRSSEWTTSQADLVRAVLSDFDLVIVDEGHYEPAFVWSQCIRELARPTVLFSATPYRNDFKYFQVRGNFAFNLGYEEATSQHLVRPVMFAGTQHLPKSGCSPSEFSDALRKFKISVLDTQYWPATLAPRRVIVRCADYESLIRMRDALKILGSSAVLIHDNVKRDDPAKLEFQSVNRALRAHESGPVEYWLHQWKLLEGVDDSTFAAIAIYEPFSASRATIQQIGRVIRVLDRTSPGKEVATVFASADIQADVQARFERYIRYERHFAKDPKRALEQESNLPNLLLQSVAPYQYLAGDFRERVPLDNSLEPPKYADFAVPLRTSIYRYSGTATLDGLATACAEAMQLEDRYNVTILLPGVAEPTSVRLIHYLTCKNSELLIRHSLPIWGLGVMVICYIDARVFILDTDGIVIDLEALGLEPECAEHLQRLIPANGKGIASRVSQASAIGLDLSESAVRSVTARMHDFASGFFDLSQSSQALHSVRASMRLQDTAVTRYLSISRASVSDYSARTQRRSVNEYFLWIQHLAAVLDSKAPISGVFDRFARSVAAPPVQDAVPMNILFDFYDLLDISLDTAGWNSAKCESLRHAETCVDVDGTGAFILNVDGEALNGNIKYSVTGNVRPRGRYDIESPELDAFVRDPNSPSTEPASIVRALNKEQAFRVIPSGSDLTYAKRLFYQTGLDIDAIAAGHEEGSPLEMLTPSPWLAQVLSEKGGGNARQWVEQSVFGGVFAEFGLSNHGAPSTARLRPLRTLDPTLSQELHTFDTVVCDDGGQEQADFMLKGENPRRVVFVHAKVNDSTMSVSSMQIVGRQAMASLAFMARGARLKDRATWWASPWSTDDLRQVPHRVLRSSNPDLAATWGEIKRCIQSAQYSKEIWIFVGRTLSKKALVRQLTRGGGPTPLSLQMTYYLGTLQTSAARANVAMRIFCSD
ncbi:DEAD/DEAH box helicase [Duganella sp. 1224]|uniref:DEAD/DEAH box helicase n=1 Tax=Duganella sp. 1224 TaxID=2587052 RepID=UPI0021061DB3|nr:DEAD/DEAH box helicase family protein [Duganella sp. 1224]